ncbi:hypothetical protein SAMN05518847_107314 [Paenibacillus sp. OV219]|nr:hypothetical protein SAMN05518847_107314 [Paenibacillus sp. OV219]
MNRPIFMLRAHIRSLSSAKLPISVVTLSESAESGLSEHESADFHTESSYYALSSPTSYRFRLFPYLRVLNLDSQSMNRPIFMLRAHIRSLSSAKLPISVAYLRVLNLDSQRINRPIFILRAHIRSLSSAKLPISAVSLSESAESGLSEDQSADFHAESTYYALSAFPSYRFRPFPYLRVLSLDSQRINRPIFMLRAHVRSLISGKLPISAVSLAESP